MITERNRHPVNSQRPPCAKGGWILPALVLAASLVALHGCGRGFIRIPHPVSDKSDGVHPAACGAYMHGIHAEQTGDWKQAREYYAAAHELDPASMRILARLAVSTYEAGMIGEAKPLLHEAEKAADEDPELAIVLARFFARQNQGTEALRYYDIAAQREDLRFPALLEAARLLENAGEKERAEEKYVALAQKVNDPMSKVILGEYYMRNGRYDAALKQFTPVAGSQPYIYGYIAVCQAETGDFDGAITSLTKYVENSCPTGPVIPQAQPGESVPVHEAADSVHGGSPWNPFKRVAATAMAKGLPARATQALEAALGCGGETPDLLELLGDAFKAQGKKDEARNAWTKALDMTEQDTDKNRLRDKIKQLDS